MVDPLASIAERMNQMSGWTDMSSGNAFWGGFGDLGDDMALEQDLREYEEMRTQLEAAGWRYSNSLGKWIPTSG